MAISDSEFFQENAGGRERHPSGSSSCSTSSGQIGSPALRQFEMMRWIDPFLGDVCVKYRFSIYEEGEV